MVLVWLVIQNAPMRTYFNVPTVNVLVKIIGAMVTRIARTEVTKGNAMVRISIVGQNCDIFLC